MPQNPLAATVAVLAGAQAPMHLSGEGSLLSAPTSSTALNVTAAKVIKTGAGRLGKLLVLVAPGSSGSITLNDCATTGAAATANQIWTIAYNATAVTAGAIFTFDIPFTTGLVISAVGGGTPQYTISYT